MPHPIWYLLVLAAWLMVLLAWTWVSKRNRTRRAIRATHRAHEAARESAHKANEPAQDGLTLRPIPNEGLPTQALPLVSPSCQACREAPAVVLRHARGGRETRLCRSCATDPRK